MTKASAVRSNGGFAELADPMNGEQQAVGSGPALDRLIIGNSREALQHLESDSISLVHTSPPYNIEKPYAHAADDLAHDEYIALLRAVFTECFRVLKPGTSLFFQSGYSQNVGDEIFPIDMLAYDIFREIGFRLWDRIIWHYRGGMSFTRKFKNTHETILWWVKPHPDGSFQPYFDVDAVREASRSYDRRNNLFGKNPGNVWSADRVAFGGRDRDTTHIAMYPESITERIIRSCSRPGEVVLDPFAGSGTTPAMARSLGRHWIGIELSPTYAAEAQRRIGRRQASEVGTLASGILKVTGFGNRPSERSWDYLIAAFTTWLQRLDLDAYRQVQEERLAGVYRGEVFVSKEIKEEKPLAWAFFDDFFMNAGASDALALGSRVLDSAYPQRTRWNSIRKYVDALRRLDELVCMADGSPGDLVRAVVRAEPTSFEVRQTAVALLASELRLRAAPTKRSRAEDTTHQASLFE